MVGQREQFAQDGKAFVMQDYGGLGVHLVPNSAIAARARRLFDQAGLLPAP